MSKAFELTRALRYLVSAAGAVGACAAGAALAATTVTAFHHTIVVAAKPSPNIYN